MQLLLSAHPDGMVVGEIAAELDIPNSTLSHHLDKLRAERLVNVQREGTFLRYSANCETLQELLGFLYVECCTRNKAIAPERIVNCCAGGEAMGTSDVRAIVKEKYGEAARRVAQGGANACCGTSAA